MNEVMIFEGREVEVFEWNGRALFNPKHVADCLDIADVNSSIRNFNGKQVVKLTNSDMHGTHIPNSKMHDMQFRKLHNTGENFLTESGVYKLIFKSHKPDAEKFQDWVTDEVLPSINKNGYYETPEHKQSNERLASVNNAVKILTPLLERAGCDSKIQLLTVKSLYEKAGILIPIEIEADQQYYDTVYIARHVGIRVKSSNKPHDKAVSEIIKRLPIDKSEYTETWECKGGWEGAVRKYAPSVIEKVRCWIEENNYPQGIEYTQTNGEKKKYHAVYEKVEVA